MKLYEFAPEAAPTPLRSGRFKQVATSPSQRWTLAVDEAGRNLMVLYHGPGWEKPGVLQTWPCARPKHAESGFIESVGRIGSVSIGGSIIAGMDRSGGGSLDRNASIRAGDDIGTLTVAGGLIGNVTPQGESFVK